MRRRFAAFLIFFTMLRQRHAMRRHAIAAMLPLRADADAAAMPCYC